MKTRTADTTMGSMAPSIDMGPSYAGGGNRDSG
jgi:hypothetical protein